MRNIRHEAHRRTGRVTVARLALVVLSMVLAASACGETDDVATFGDGIAAEDCPEADRNDDGTCRTAPLPPPAAGAIVDSETLPPIVPSCGPLHFAGGLASIDDLPQYEGTIAELMPEQAQPEYQASIDWFDSHTWRVAERNDAGLSLLGIGEYDSGPSYAYILVEGSEDDLTATGWGGCRMAADAEGFGVAEFEFDPANPPDPASAQLHLLATERACANGLPPTGRLVVPSVTETQDTVEITVLVEPVQGGAICPSNPPFAVVVALESPLGDRAVLDASSLPPEERTWPLEQRPPELSVAAAGDPPSPGTAHVVGWDGLYGGALMLSAAEWSSYADGFQYFPGDEATTITGWVTSCGPDGCVEECENEGNPLRDQQVQGDDDNPELPLCSDLVRLGDECSLTYQPVEGIDAALTVTFGGDTCTIDVVTTPIDP